MLAFRDDVKEGQEKNRQTGHTQGRRYERPRTAQVDVEPDLTLLQVAKAQPPQEVQKFNQFDRHAHPLNPEWDSLPNILF